MRVFKTFNQSAKDACPICGTTEQKEVVLVTKADTFKEHELNQDAVQVHVDCIDLICMRENGIITLVMQCAAPVTQQDDKLLVSNEGH